MCRYEKLVFEIDIFMLVGIKKITVFLIVTL
jgi:hypothetical protein